ncbi:hypothetical protein B0B52_07035 [Polaromonas sp. A23]|nr:hypothetical protein B0B52_07035 [Polaromonas sp. A23]
MAPTLVTACTSLPPGGAAAPAGRQSRTRGPCLKETSPHGRSLRVASCYPREAPFKEGTP